MKVLIFSDGKQIPVVKDNGKYWITEDSQFKKSNKAIIEVKTVKEEKKKKEKKETAEKAVAEEKVETVKISDEENIEVKKEG